MMSDIAAYKCRLCGSGRASTLLDVRDEGYSLRKCIDCSFVTTYPIPTEAELSKYYNDNYWPNSGEPATSMLKTLLFLRMREVLFELKRLLPKSRRVLDWGAGDGSWLEILRNEGFDGYGLDQYSNATKDKFLRRGSIENAGFPDNFFDAISCFHVLEHLRDPVGNIRTAVQMLKPSGVMIVEVPNISSFGFIIFKNRWQPLELPVHLNHFSPETLRRLFGEVGNLQVFKVSFFSHRASPSALVLSLFPFFAPKTVRYKHSGRYPLFLMSVYLFMQLFIYPFAALEALFKRGGIIRLYVRKV